MPNDNIRIAITSDSISHRNFLQKTMEQSGIDVVLNESLTERFMKKLEGVASDLVLFDIESIEDEHLEYLEQLLEQTEIPIIINDVSALTLNEPKSSLKWNSNLLEKIADITGRNSWDESCTIVKSKKASVNKNAKYEIAKNVWVLGASLGGPEALKHFLAEIPKKLPVTFIVAQHLGENFVRLLAEQLDRYTEFNVIVPQQGHVVRHQEVLVTPTDKRLLINSIGAIELKELTEKTKYTPSINDVISEVASRYNKYAGAIIFSGMCDDGVNGCEYLAEKGGQVWLQSADSCVISAMTESVEKKVAIGFSGTPELLAMQLISFYKDTY